MRVRSGCSKLKKETRKKKLLRVTVMAAAKEIAVIRIGHKKDIKAALKAFLCEKHHFAFFYDVHTRSNSRDEVGRMEYTISENEC